MEVCGNYRKWWYGMRKMKEKKNSFEKVKEKGKEREKERVWSERLGLNVWGPRSVQIPRLRIKSLNTVTGVTKDDGPGVRHNDGRHEGWRVRRKKPRRPSTRCDQQTVGMDDNRHTSWRSTRRWLFENRCWLTETSLSDWNLLRNILLENLLKENAINGLPPIQRFVLRRKLDCSEWHNQGGHITRVATCPTFSAGW